MTVPSNVGCLIGLVVLVCLAYSEAKTCQDKIPNCQDYPKACYEHRPWAIDNCERTCGICSQSEYCPDYWEYNSGDDTCVGAFGIETSGDRNTWDSARRACQGYGGDLVVIKDETKNLLVKGMVPIRGFVWIGLKNVASDASRYQFKYVDNSWLGGYHPWIPGNPDNYDGEERCVTFDRRTMRGYWNDFNCQEKIGFICQKKAIKSRG